MRNLTLSTLLIPALFFASCSGGGGLPVIPPEGPQAPINNPDTGVFNPGGGGGSGSSNGGGSGNSGSTGTGSGTGTGGTGTGGTGTGTGGTGSSGTGGGGSGGGVGSGGGSGSQPVPEPGTLILFGSGLAGLGASMLRRRRGAKVENQAT